MMKNLFHFLKHFQKINLKFFIKMELLQKKNYLLIPKNQKGNQSSTKETNSTRNDIHTKISSIEEILSIIFKP